MIYSQKECIGGPNRLPSGLCAGDGRRQLFGSGEGTRPRPARHQQAYRPARAGIRIAALPAHDAKAQAHTRGTSHLRSGATASRHIRNGAGQHQAVRAAALRHFARQHRIVIRPALHDADHRRICAGLSGGPARSPLRRTNGQPGRGRYRTGASHRRTRVRARCCRDVSARCDAIWWRRRPICTSGRCRALRTI